MGFVITGSTFDDVLWRKKISQFEIYNVSHQSGGYQKQRRLQTGGVGETNIRSHKLLSGGCARGIPLIRMIH